MHILISPYSMEVIQMFFGQCGIHTPGGSSHKLMVTRVAPNVFGKVWHSLLHLIAILSVFKLQCQIKHCGYHLENVRRLLDGML